MHWALTEHHMFPATVHRLRRALSTVAVGAVHRMVGAVRPRRARGPAGALGARRRPGAVLTSAVRQAVTGRYPERLAAITSSPTPQYLDIPAAWPSVATAPSLPPCARESASPDITAIARCPGGNRPSWAMRNSILAPYLGFSDRRSTRHCSSGSPDCGRYQALSSSRSVRCRHGVESPLSRAAPRSISRCREKSSRR